MKQQDLISVIIPSYNAEKYIERISNALMKQTYGNFEAIFVDDGSKDGTEAQCRNVFINDNRFIYVKKENGGPASARNLGLKLAKGNYIAFIDVDDYVYPEYLEYLYNLLIEHDADISCCEYWKTSDFSKRPADQSEQCIKEFSAIDALKNMYIKKYINGYPVLKLYKRKVIENVVFPEEISYAEDIIFVDKVIKKCNKVVYGNKILYLYYQVDTSITHSVNVSELRTSWKENETYFCHGNKEKYPELLPAAACKQFIMALDLATRVYGKDKIFQNELKDYIKKVRKGVLKNRDNKSMHRLLAALCCININMLIVMCMCYRKIQQKFKLQSRKAL